MQDHGFTVNSSSRVRVPALGAGACLSFPSPEPLPSLELPPGCSPLKTAPGRTIPRTIITTAEPGLALRAPEPLRRRRQGAAVHRTGALGGFWSLLATLPEDLQLEECSKNPKVKMLSTVSRRSWVSVAVRIYLPFLAPLAELVFFSTSASFASSSSTRPCKARRRRVSAWAWRSAWTCSRRAAMNSAVRSRAWR
jgi:hypothetical protein